MLKQGADHFSFLRGKTDGLPSENQEKPVLLLFLAIELQQLTALKERNAIGYGNNSKL